MPPRLWTGARPSGPGPPPGLREARPWVAGVLAVLLLAAGAGGCAAALPGVEVPYVPTPPEVVRAMLALAAVGPGDLVYDLGSGDGRVVLAAARDFGARGLGVELDPRLVSESAEAARRSGVADRARFVVQDFFDTDLAPATVVTLYLSSELNTRLRPKLLRELRPGARVVSHEFPIAGWAPRQVITVEVRGRRHAVSLWVVPPSP